MSNKKFSKWQWFFKQPKEFKEELLSIDRVTRVTAWWRQLRFRAVMVIWNEKWKVGLWTWKSWEVVDAIAKAINNAKKNLVTLKIDEKTVPYNINVKYKSAKIMIHQASEWTWIIAWGSIRKVLSVAWYKDVLAKRYWSNNKINNAKATIKALTSFKKIETKIVNPNNEDLSKVNKEEIKKEVIKEKPKTNKIDKVEEKIKTTTKKITKTTKVAK